MPKVKGPLLVVGVAPVKVREGTVALPGALAGLALVEGKLNLTDGYQLRSCIIPVGLDLHDFSAGQGVYARAYGDGTSRLTFPC